MQNGKFSSNTVGFAYNLLTMLFLASAYLVLILLPLPISILVSIGFSLMALITGYLMVLSIRS